jgi:hypothetical protein
MKLTKDLLNDKVKLLETVGYTAVDSAIPQPWFDQLLDMGIESPGFYFATENSGISPKLLHVGDAIHQLLEHRSKANQELAVQLLESEARIYSTLIWSDTSAILDEALAGLLDLNMIVQAYEQGVKDGQDAIKKAQA